MKCADALLQDNKRTILKVRVAPQSKTYAICYDDIRQEFKIKVKANPERGKANADLIKFLSKYFKTPKILSGHTKKSKRIAVSNTLEETVAIMEEIIL